MYKPWLKCERPKHAQTQLTGDAEKSEQQSNLMTFGWFSSIRILSTQHP